jgi:hypothetical protein
MSDIKLDDGEKNWLYILMGVRIARGNEQQTAPAKTHLEGSVISLSQRHPRGTAATALAIKFPAAPAWSGCILMIKFASSDVIAE